MDDPLSREYAEALRGLKSRLDRDLVKQLDVGDFAENLLQHLRIRKEPKLLFSAGNLPHISEATRRLDPDEFAWEKEIADNAVEGRLYGASNLYCCRFIQIDRNAFDFSAYDHPDPQTIYGLGRHRWYASLARTYWDNCEPRYFHALMDQWDFFIEKVPFHGEAFSRDVHAIGPVGMAPPFAELDVFIRLTNWWWAYWVILHAAEMTPERNVILLHRCLSLFDLVAARGIRRHESNFTAMQMEALYHWAVSLPEASGMPVWKHAVRNTMESSLERAVFPDGVQWEKSACYHRGCIRWYGTGYLLGRINGEPWAEEYGVRLRKMGVFVDAIITPDNKLPLLSDSDRNGSWRGPLALLKCLFPDLTFRRPVAPTYFSLWVSDGYEWDPNETRAPKETLSIFPNAGVAVVRNPNPVAGAMVILDNGPTNAGHSHKDNLTIHYEALGQPILVDPGRAVYRDDADRSWVIYCQSHNTLYIEDKPIRAGDWIEENALQIISSTEDPRIGTIRTEERDDIILITSSFKGFVADPEAAVHRTVIFPLGESDIWLAVIDDIRANTSHTWTNSWLFPAAEPVQETEGACSIQLESDLRVSFAFAPTVPLTMRDDPMFWCPQYAEKSPARWVRFSAQCTLGRRAFIFQPAVGEEEVPGITLEESRVRLRVGGKERLIST